MKIRTQFISNSSSTSFAILGIKVDKPDFDDDYDAEDDWLTRNNIHRINDDYWIYDEKLWQGEEYDCEEYSLEELNQKAEKFAAKYNANKSDVKIFIGEVQC